LRQRRSIRFGKHESRPGSLKDKIIVVTGAKMRFVPLVGWRMRALAALIDSFSEPRSS
jgi:hypothetical protein